MGEENKEGDLPHPLLSPSPSVEGEE